MRVQLGQEYRGIGTGQDMLFLDRIFVKNRGKEDEEIVNPLVSICYSML